MIRGEGLTYAVNIHWQSWYNCHYVDLALFIAYDCAPPYLFLVCTPCSQLNTGVCQWAVKKLDPHWASAWYKMENQMPMRLPEIKYQTQCGPAWWCVNISPCCWLGWLLQGWVIKTSLMVIDVYRGAARPVHSLQGWEAQRCLQSVKMMKWTQNIESLRGQHQPSQPSRPSP